MGKGEDRALVCVVRGELLGIEVTGPGRPAPQGGIKSQNQKITAFT
jgi:hypothetical protein